jgi:DNA-binding GntR family transcriptional regulator
LYYNFCNVKREIMPDDQSTRASADPTPRIRQAILEGRFSPNERLVEEELVRIFGSTRPAIRQGLAVLEQQGLVVRERNRGARVRLISAAEAIEIMELRAVIEAMVAGHAAQRITAAESDRLRSMIAHLEALTAAGDLVSYSEANVQFHAAIARIAQHQSAERILNGLRSQTVAFQYRPIMEPGRAAAIDAEHRVLVAALAAGDAAAAEAAMRTHIGNAKRALQAAIAGRRVVRDPVL